MFSSVYFRVSKWDTYDKQQIRVPVEADHAERIQPLPHLHSLLLSPQTFQFLGPFLVDRFGLQEEAEDSGGTSQGRLQPEDISPRSESDDYTSDEGAQRWTDQSAAHEPSESSCSFSLLCR